MIYKSFDGEPQLVGNYSERAMTQKFRVAYENKISGITGTAPLAGHDITNLISEVYLENVKWSGAPTLTLNLGTAQKINCIIIGNPSFNLLTGGIYNGASLILDFSKTYWITDKGYYVKASDSKRIVFNVGSTGINLVKKLAPGTESGDVTDQNILVLLFNSVQATSIQMGFSGGAGNTINKLYAGSYVEWLIGEGFLYFL